MSEESSPRGMDRWRGRVALVTGASSGIGRQLARQLAAQGMKVALCARRGDRLEQLEQEILEAHPGAQTLKLVCDLKREADVLGAFSKLRESWGGVDVLVNNAGLGYASSLLEGEPSQWREMLEVNVVALCIMTQQAILDMRRRGDDGHVIHISSMAAHRVPPGSGVYSASKYAVRSLTEGLRCELRELASKIRVSSVSPGYVETEFHSNFYGDEKKAQATYSRFKVLEAADIADTVGFILASPEHMQVHDVLVRPRDQAS